jgi:mediator of replication checkpoint protein 1
MGISCFPPKPLLTTFADRERERADDEKQVDKLFRDITTGMLRRKRGADYDLSDSDDGGEARRRMKRRQFAKMQKALFADERIKKIAENPGNQAFLRTIEDRGSDDEDMDFLEFAPAEPSMDGEDSQSQDQDDHVVPDSQPEEEGRRPLGTQAGAPNRAPAHLRRTKDGKKPSNISEIRESLSTLLDEPVAVIPSTDLGSDDSDAEDEDEGEDEDEDSREDQRPSPSSSDKENHSWTRPNPRRTAKPQTAVVDRISLKRQSSSTLSTSSTSRLAFAAPSSAASTFKVPALLRRATTNSLLSNSSSTSSSGVSTPANTFGRSAGGSGAGGFGADDGKIKKTAGKRSGVSYLARENERRAALAERETRREAKKWRGAEKRVKAVGGLFGSGKFE